MRIPITPLPWTGPTGFLENFAPAAQPVGVVLQAVGYHQATLTITHKTPSKVTLKLKPINKGK